MRLLLAAVLLLAAGAVSAAGIRIIDGDTFEAGDRTVRLANIDAPEAGQTCRDADGRAYDCGRAATRALRQLLSGAELRCRADGEDRYGRTIAHCTADGRDVGAAMVVSGHAVAYRRFGTEYVDEELAAAKARRGIWAGGFTLPEDHRAALREGAERKAGPARGAAARQDGCRIKGNISGNGRIYHVPGGEYYDRTRISTSRGERWFCSEAEARAAGWRAPRG